MPSVNSQGVDINYERAGQDPTVVFCHGFTGSLHDWDNQVPLLVKTGYQVVAIDSRGHGKSAAPSTARAYSVSIFARDTYEVIQALGIKKCCLVGHSMGGFNVLELILAHPEIAQALILVGSSAERPMWPPGYKELRAKVDRIARTQGLEAAFEYNATHWERMRQRFERHPEQREIAKRKTLQTSVNGYIYTTRAINQWAGVSSRLSEIAVPALIIIGEEDEPFIEISKMHQATIRGARRIVIPGAGHNPHEEQPQAFNQALLSFLKEAMPA